MDPKNTEAMIELLKKELGPIADAMGQGAGKTFQIFVKQAWVNAIQNMLFMPVGVILIILSIYMFRYGRGKGEYGNTKWQGMEWMVLIGGIGIGLIAILVPLSGIIQVKINPEYAALQLMLNTFRNPTR